MYIYTYSNNIYKYCTLENFCLNYFVVENIQEKIFGVSQYPQKYFNNGLKSIASCSIAIIAANSYHNSFIPCKIYYQATAVERISNR